MIQIPIKSKGTSKGTPEVFTIRPETMDEFTSLKPGHFSKFGLLGIMLILIILIFVAGNTPYPESLILKGKLNEKWITLKVHSDSGQAITKEKIIFCEFIIPQKHYSKFMVGMPMLVNLEAYPSQKYGFLQAKIDSISLVASEIGFSSFLSLPKVSITTNNKLIDYRVGMNAECILIIKEGTLLERLYNNAMIERN